MSEFPKEDWWAWYQLDLVDDRNRKWALTEFVPQQSFTIIRDGKRMQGKVSQHDKLPKDAVLDGPMWDHEHCELCNHKIMIHDDYDNEGYYDGTEWVCVNCYEKYILPRENAAL